MPMSESASNQRELFVTLTRSLGIDHVSYALFVNSSARPLVNADGIGFLPLFLDLPPDHVLGTSLPKHRQERRGPDSAQPKRRGKRLFQDTPERRARVLRIVGSRYGLEHANRRRRRDENRDRG